MVDRDEAERLLALSREVDWAFPSSSGRPVPAWQDAGGWVERLAAERGAFVEAAVFLVEDGDGEAATELAANVWRLWVVAGDAVGGRAFLEAVLDAGAPVPTRARALALYGDGLFAFRQGATAASRERNEAALEAARAVGDPEAEALALLGLSRVAFTDAEYERARALAAQSRARTRGLAPALGQAPLHMLAQGTRFTGDDDLAAALFSESLALNRHLGDRGMVVVELHNLGHVEMHRGNVEAAERCFAECAELSADDDLYGEAMRHLNRAVVAFARGDRRTATGLLRSADATLAVAGEEPAADDAFEMERLRRQLAGAANGS